MRSPHGWCRELICSLVVSGGSDWASGVVRVTVKDTDAEFADAENVRRGS